jgi:hypothetical protein
VGLPVCVGLPVNDLNSRGSASSSDVSRSSDGAASALLAEQRKYRRFLPNTVPPTALEAPPHLIAEAATISAGRNEAWKITGSELTPLVSATGIFLANHGVVNRADAPKMIESVCHQIQEKSGFNDKMIARGNRVRPVPFVQKVVTWLQDNIGRGSFKLQVREGSELTTPQRDLQLRGKVVIVPSPIQGHSGNSIVGRGRVGPSIPEDSPMQFPGTAASPPLPSSPLHPCMETAPAPVPALAAAPAPAPLTAFPAALSTGHGINLVWEVGAPNRQAAAAGVVAGGRQAEDEEDIPIRPGKIRKQRLVDSSDDEDSDDEDVPIHQVARKEKDAASQSTEPTVSKKQAKLQQEAVKAEREATRELGPIVMGATPSAHPTLLAVDVKSRGRIVFMPSMAYGKAVSKCLPEGAVGWRAVVEGMKKDKLLITTLGEENTRNARVGFNAAAIHAKGIYAITG